MSSYHKVAFFKIKKALIASAKFLARATKARLLFNFNFDFNIFAIPQVEKLFPGLASCTKTIITTRAAATDIYRTISGDLYRVNFSFFRLQ